MSILANDGPVADEVDVPGEDDATASSARKSWLRRTWSLAAAAAIVALAVLVVLFSRGGWWGSTPSHAGDRDQALAAAKSCIATMNTYNYKSLDAAEKKALDCTTGSFTQTYRQAFQSLRTQATDAHAAQTFQVDNAGIAQVSSDYKQIQVLVFGQISVTSSSTGGSPSYSVLSAEVTMQKTSEGWRVAGYRTAP
ncbi:MAG TPA: hypothetical protein VGL26_04455 [Jatrophihabitans sp.]|jgi:hypothetical protein